ncbi:MAG: hypothetical protein QNJ81_07225 [Acidimicrobiia bacterium]|nr:hypothetical protein [Acidimicrobiia bacterium]
MTKRKRVRLPVGVQVGGDDLKPVYVTVSGYGDFLGKYSVGRVELRTSRIVLVTVKFGTGKKAVERTETFRVSDGMMLPYDKRSKTGWKINTNDLDTEYCPFPDAESETTSAPSGFSIINTETLHVYGHEKLVAEIWRGPNEELYVKTYRINTDPEAKRARQLPAIVPFNQLAALVAEYSSI